MFCFLNFHSWTKRPATLNPKRLVRRCRKCGKVSVVSRKSATRATVVAPVEMACEPMAREHATAD